MAHVASLKLYVSTDMKFTPESRYIYHRHVPNELCALLAGGIV